jgi:hypothetical protein
VLKHFLSFYKDAFIVKTAMYSCSFSSKIFQRSFAKKLLTGALHFDKLIQGRKKSWAKTNFGLVLVQKLMNIDFIIKNGCIHTNDFPKKHVNHVVDSKNSFIQKQSKLFCLKNYSNCFYSQKDS